MSRSVLVTALALVIGCSNRSEAPTTKGELANQAGDHANRQLATLASRFPLLASAIRARPSDHLPSLSTDGFEVAQGALRVRPLDLRPSRGQRQGGALFFPSVGERTDLVMVGGDSWSEDLRIVHEASDVITTRYRVTLGAAVSATRVREGRFEALDANGVVLADTSPAFAVDVSGRRRDLLPVVREIGDREREISFSLATQGLTFPVVIDPTWGSGGSMKHPRMSHVAVRLASGKVLVAGGSDGISGAVAESEVYDPATNTWSASGSLLTPRAMASAVLLASGKILLVGGDVPDPTPSEVWDPATGSWTAAKTLPGKRIGPVLALLPSGRVLAAAGEDNGTWPTARGESWEWDPGLDAWTAVGSLTKVGGATRGVSLSDGRVVVAGGSDPSTGDATGASQVYSPGSKSWTVSGTMSTPRFEHTLTLLSADKVLVIGGLDAAWAGLSSAQIWDPTSGAWANAGSMVSSRRGHASARVPAGLVLVTGGSIDPYGAELSTATLFDPVKPVGSSFSTAPSSTGARLRPTATTLSNGRVLVVGLATGTGPASELFTASDLAAACSSNAECISGFCVDGVCCNSACTGQCSACDIAGNVGTCSAVASGAPHGARTSCSPYFCASGTCATTCSSDSNCVTGNYCDATNKCVPKKANGVACSATNQCTSGICVDGVCCNATCGGQCEACNVTGKLGTCSPVNGAPHGTRTACASSADVCAAKLCNGVDTTQCHFPPVSTTCSANACNTGVETHASTCDGVGACKDVAKSCGVYVCGSAACKTSCTGKADCVPGYSCVGGACTPSIGLGKPCSDVTACGDLFCVDGVCCGVTSCPSGQTCASPGKEGICTRKLGQSCANDAECGSAHCVDGVCCDSTCGGQCEACDVAGSMGTCTGIAGTPHGKRSACDDGAGKACAARACDGVKDRTTCAGYADAAGKSCGEARCDSTGFIAAPKCDGAGSCSSPPASSCVPYACDLTGCKTTCTAQTDCANDYSCKDNKCVANGATCSEDQLSSVSKDGVPTDCRPHRCTSTGECGKKCATSNDCAPGSVCTVATGTCDPAPAETESDGGCAFGPPATHRSALALVVMAASLGLLARRRRGNAARPG